MAHRLSPTAYHYAFVTPALCLSVVIVLAPGLLTFAVAFTDWDGISQPVFAGLHNFADLFGDQVFWAAVVNNVQWALIFLTIPMVIALVIASFPNIAASVRRLHDIDRTGWWVLIGFIPLGVIVLIYFLALPGEPHANRFGPPPP